MLNIEDWLTDFQRLLDARFGARVWFVGLQGSWARGEATAASDIDVVVILDSLTATDICAYRALLDMLPAREKVCGFLSGRDELLHWAAAELFQFCHDTRAFYGSLDAVLALVDDKAVAAAIHQGICSIYHGCVHNMVHEKDRTILRDLYKTAAFVVQAIVYRQCGKYVVKQRDLRLLAAPEEAAILRTAQALKAGVPLDIDAASAQLFCWAQSWLTAF